VKSDQEAMKTVSQNGNSLRSNQRLRLAIVVSHPIQHFAPWYRELANLPELDLKVFYCCDWGAESYRDPEFGVDIKWDIPLLEGYEFEFLPIRKRPENMTFWSVDNPTVGDALSRFNPDVVQVYGYASRTNWRVARWSKAHRRPLMIYSDSNVQGSTAAWKRGLKRAIVGYFYRQMDGAFYVGNNNYAYHADYGIPADRLFPGMLPVDMAALLRGVPDSVAARNEIRNELGIPPESFVVLLCGKLSKRKRPMDLVDAAHRAKKSGAGVWAVLVGDGPERVNIEEFCRKQKVENVRLSGFVNQARIPLYYAAADCLAVTSEMDPHPLVVTEAATFGLPAIVSDAIGCIGANDTARIGENAFSYPCGDVESLKDILVMLSNDPAARESARAASLRIAQNQDVTVAAKQLFDAAKNLRELGVRR
jgi:glycosyltransferase involved in cell wall biosynthesis